VDGGFYGNASYDATEKALVFDGSNDYIMTDRLGNASGAYIHSVSAWFRLNDLSATNIISQIGKGADVATKRIQFAINTSGTVTLGLNGSNTQFNPNITSGKWYHIVYTYNGGADGSSSTAYTLHVNGVSYTVSGGTNSATLNLDADAILSIGLDHTLTGTSLNGSISNFKLYDVALTADEVKRLYDMGRLGNVIAQPVHIAAPLYAPGTIVQVEQSVKTDTSSTNSQTVVNISGLGVTIHPKFSTSKILVSYSVNVGTANAHGFLRVKRTQGGSSTYIGDGLASGSRKQCTSYIYNNVGSYCESYSFEHLDDANGTTEPITYEIQMFVASTSYTLHINRSGNDTSDAYHGRTSSSITAKEVCQ
jgi:hypothetical protein